VFAQLAVVDNKSVIADAINEQRVVLKGLIRRAPVLGLCSRDEIDLEDTTVLGPDKR
jgi:hypothetical protein